jgi:hypothetical protein
MDHTREVPIGATEKIRTVCKETLQSLVTTFTNMELEIKLTNSPERQRCWTNIVSKLIQLGIHSLNLLLAHSIAVNTSHRLYGYYKPSFCVPECVLSHGV